MFKVTPHERRTVSWWLSNRHKIDFAPPYQRSGGQWDYEKKAYLIDSIVNGYDLPKIYFADFNYFNNQLNKSRKSYAVIDGRQRLEAMVDFYEDKFSLSQDFVFSNENFDSSGEVGFTSYTGAGMRFSELKEKCPQIATAFEQFNLDVVSVITNDFGRINDLFVRLNSSKPLSGAQIRNAMEGVVPDSIRQVAAHEFFTSKVAFSKNRGQDQNAAAKLLLLEFRGTLVDLKKRHLDAFANHDPEAEVSSFADEAEAVSNINVNEALSRVVNNLERMLKVFNNSDSLLSTEGVIPVYYWFIRGLRDVGDVNNIREFLDAFTKEVRKYAASNETSLTKESLQDYARYSLLNRSTNDKGSLIGRISILSKMYNDYSNGR